jgi:hypothetical protein
MRYAVIPLLAVLLTPASALAQNAAPYVQVLEIRSADAAPHALAVTMVAKQQLGRPVVPGPGFDELSRQLGCSQPDSACLAKMADHLGSDQLIWGQARRTPGAVVFELRMYSRGEPVRYTEFSLADSIADPNDPRLQAAVHQSLQAIITRGGVATVNLQVGAIDGQVLIDGRPGTELRMGRASFPLRGGEHTIEVRAKGYAAALRSVFVQPGTVTNLDLVPVPLDAAASQSGSPTSWRKPVGWTAVGAGVLLTGLGVWSTLTVKSVNNDDGFKDYKSGVQGTGDVCDVAASGQQSSNPNAASPSEVNRMCDKATLHERLQFVFYGLAAVTTGVGVYLIVSDPGPARPETSTRLKLTPTAGPHGGALWATMRF